MSSNLPVIVPSTETQMQVVRYVPQPQLQFQPQPEGPPLSPSPSPSPSLSPSPSPSPAPPNAHSLPQPTALVAFFAQWPAFNYNPASPACSEFDRLAASQHWNLTVSTHPTYAIAQAAKAQLSKALVQQFNEIYGTRDGNGLEGWQRLCKRVDIVPVPSTIGGARKAVRTVYVCLVDLVDKYATSEPITKFRSAKELRKYVQKENKIFPKDEAKSTGLLRHLLRSIFNFRRRSPRQ